LSIRINELLTPYAASWSGVIDAGSGDIDVDSFVRLPGLQITKVGRQGFDGDAISPDGLSLDDRALVVVTAGPKPHYHGTSRLAFAMLEQVAPGGYVLLMLGWTAPQLREAGLGAQLAGAGFDPEEVVGTPYVSLPVAVLARRTRSGSGEVDENAMAAFDQALAEVAAVRLGEEVAQLKEALSIRGSQTDPTLRLTELTRERAELTTALREAQGQLRSAERKIISLESSSSMRVGQALIGAAKNPRKALKLPREAARMLKLRGGRAGIAKARTLQGAIEEPTHSPEIKRLVAWRGAGLDPRTKLSIAGALQPSTVATLSGHAFVSTMTPDDAVAVIEQGDPDVVLIETATARPSSPWAYLADPAATEREARLKSAVEAAQVAGRPVVFWRNTAVHLTAALDDFAATCDLVLDSAPARAGGTYWSPGVDLASGFAATGGDRSGVLYVGELDPRLSAPRQQLLLDVLDAAGSDLLIRPRAMANDDQSFPDRLTAYVGSSVRPDELASAYKSAAVVLASPLVVSSSLMGLSDEHLLALACGARVVSGPNQDLAALEGFGSALVVAQDVVGAVQNAVALGAQTRHEYLNTLRTLFLHHSVPARLKQLADELALAMPANQSRAVSVVLAPGDDLNAAALIDALAIQSWKPHEVIVSSADVPSPRALDELTAMGVKVLTIDGSTWSDLARATDAHWVAVWSSAAGENHWHENTLLDRLVVGEATGSDGVGAGGVLCVLDSSRRISGPVLLKRTSILEVSSVDLDQWHNAGRRFFGVEDAQ
jgi:hypothetical protein